MPFFDICYEIRDGERTYTQHEVVIAKQRVAAQQYAEACLQEWYGEEGETIWNPKEKVASERSGETCVKLLCIHDVGKRTIFDLDRHGWVSVSMVLDTPSIVCA